MSRPCRDESPDLNVLFVRRMYAPNPVGPDETSVLALPVLGRLRQKVAEESSQGP